MNNSDNRTYVLVYVFREQYYLIWPVLKFNSIQFIHHIIIKHNISLSDYSISSSFCVFNTFFLFCSVDFMLLIIFRFVVFSHKDFKCYVLILNKSSNLEYRSRLLNLGSVKEAGKLFPILCGSQGDF